jgi:hypothetical protein
MTKWGNRPHWEFDGVYLGRDEHGDWLGFTAGTLMARPGMEVRPPNDQVGLVPADGPDQGRSWLATFHAPGGIVQTYVDMTTPPYWEDHTVHAVDLDLDVIKSLEGEVFVDDQDEFDLHRVQHAYPDDVVSLATSTRDLVLAGMRDQQPPFDGSHQRWLDLLVELGSEAVEP